MRVNGEEVLLRVADPPNWVRSNGPERRMEVSTFVSNDCNFLLEFWHWFRWGRHVSAPRIESRNTHKIVKGLYIIIRNTANECSAFVIPRRPIYRPYLVSDPWHGGGSGLRSGEWDQIGEIIRHSSCLGSGHPGNDDDSGVKGYPGPRLNWKLPLLGDSSSIS